MTISTHILDISRGRPAPAVAVTLTTPSAVLSATTDDDGRHRFLLDDPTPGTHTIRFETASYYAAQHIEGLYPHVEIVFLVSAGETHYHIPLLLTANGYTTYRGS